MKALEGVEKRDIRNLLGKGWLTHDGMWFYHVYREFGIETANELNKAAIKSMAPIEVDRIKRILGVTGRLETFDEVMGFMLAGLELILPGSVARKLHFTPLAGNRMCWKWVASECFAYKGMKNIGAIDGYRCGVMYRIECWLDALDIGYAMRPKIEGCLMHEKGACEGEIQIVLPVQDGD